VTFVVVMGLAVYLAVYVSLSLLPQGRPAGLGIGIAALAAAGIWITNGGEDGFVLLLMVAVAAGIAGAALMQGLRLAAGEVVRGWLYAALLPVGALLPPIVAFALYGG
jgi:hypothetical protein